MSTAHDGTNLTPGASRLGRLGSPRRMVQVTVAGKQHCPFCREVLAKGDPLLVCPACRATFHEECVGEEGRCSTLGCPNAHPDLPRPRKGRRALVVGVAALLLSAGIAWFAWNDPEAVGCDPPPKPPVAHSLSVVVDNPAHGSVVTRNHGAIQVSGRLTVSQSIARQSPQVFVGGQPAQVKIWWPRCGTGLEENYSVQGEFHTQVSLGPGTHTLPVVARCSGLESHTQWTVTVSAPPPPPPPPPPPRPASRHWEITPLPETTTSAEVIVQGTIHSAPASVTVQGPAGQHVSYQVDEPGPFAGAVSLPTLGVHQVQVVVVDTWGTRTTHRYQVQRLSGAARPVVVGERYR